MIERKRVIPGHDRKAESYTFGMCLYGELGWDEEVDRIGCVYIRRTVTSRAGWLRGRNSEETVLW